jgi:hypothetical protein
LLGGADVQVHLDLDDVIDKAIASKSVFELEHRANLYKGQTLVFVRGYNVSFEEALQRAGQIAVPGSPLRRGRSSAAPRAHKPWRPDSSIAQHK